jgi:hypothetical protein
MARYQLRMHGWSCGAAFIPQGAIIDDVAGTDDWSNLVRTRGLFPPINAEPLDAGTWATMKAFYSGNNAANPYAPDMTPWIVTGPGITR